MDKEIKERIAAINSGIVPEGYKKTKVGIVPVEWEEIKLGEMCFISAGGDIEKEHCQSYKDEKYKYPVYANALTNRGLYGYSDVFKISGETVTVTGRGEIGYAIARGEKYYPIVRLLILKPKKKTNIVFLANLINSSKIYIESTGVPQLTAPQLSLLKIVIPPLPEQQKIAEILSTQDKLIELQEKKIEQLKELKKAYLQKMFPKKGGKYPELRFKGFTDPWEQRKLGDMCDEFQSGKSIKASEITDSGKYAVYGGNGFRGYTDTYNHDGDYALIGRQGALCGNMNFSSGKAYFTEHAVAVRGNADNDTLFLYYLLDLMNLGQYSGQSAQPGLAVNKIIQLKTKAPKLDEQRLISSFFKQLDTLITLHQRKSEQEKQKKKALMQLLLTGIVRTK